MVRAGLALGERGGARWAQAGEVELAAHADHGGAQREDTQRNAVEEAFVRFPVAAFERVPDRGDRERPAAERGADVDLATGR